MVLLHVLFSIFINYYILHVNSEEIDLLPDVKSYPTKWDNMNVDQIFASDRLVIAYKKCLMDEGVCTPDGEDLKKYLADALATDCRKCSAAQKGFVEKTANSLIMKKPEMWKELRVRYDPQNTYYNKYFDESGKLIRPLPT